MRTSEIKKACTIAYKEYEKKLNELKDKNYPCKLNLSESEMEALKTSMEPHTLNEFIKHLGEYLERNTLESKIYLDSIIDPLLVEIRDRQYHKKAFINQWRRRSAAGGHFSGSKYFSKLVKRTYPKRLNNLKNELKTAEETVREEFLWLKDKYLKATSQRDNK